MVVLDTDHLRSVEANGEVGEQLRQKLRGCGQEFATTVVSVLEAINGWIVEINRQGRFPHGQILAYTEFSRVVETYSSWIVLPWHVEEADLFVSHRTKGVRIGSMDLKIACIVMAHDAVLLTRNTVDFQQVPGLRFENWLD